MERLPRAVVVCLTAFCLVGFTGFAVDAQEEGSSEQTQGMPSLVSMVPGLVPVEDYSGDVWTRRAMTGDWGGVRTKMAERGIFLDVEVTQVLQDNAYGGRSTNNGLQYMGSADYLLHVDTGRLGLWPGGLWKLHGETQFGRSVNSKTGSLMTPNYDSLLPRPDDPGLTTLSELYVMQGLTKYCLLVAGKMDGSSFADTNAFANSEKTQFLNLALRNNPMLFPYAPYTALGIVALLMPLGNDDVSIALGAVNTNDSVTEAGFSSWIYSPEGTTILGELDVKVKPFDLPGTFRFGGLWTSKKFTSFNQDPRLLLQGAPLEREDDPYVLYFNFDQYFYVEDEKTNQGAGLFGRYGFGPDKNAINQYFSLGVGGKGVVPGRDNDRFGVGYYYTHLSGDLTGNRLLRRFDLDAEQGVEIFYNFEITPWITITPDLQMIIDPSQFGGREDFADPDFALVLGARVQMSF